jgi:hypothetical protein
MPGTPGKVVVNLANMWIGYQYGRLSSTELVTLELRTMSVHNHGTENNSV